MKKFLIAAVITAAIFAPKWHFRTMEVVHIQPNGYVTLWDSNGNAWGIYADDVEIGDRLVCTCYGEGERMEIRSFWKEGEGK